MCFEASRLRAVSRRQMIVGKCFDLLSLGILRASSGSLEGVGPAGGSVTRSPRAGGRAGSSAGRSLRAGGRHVGRSVGDSGGSGGRVGRVAGRWVGRLGRTGCV